MSLRSVLSFVSILLFIVANFDQISSQNPKNGRRRPVITEIPGVGKVRGREILSAWSGQTIYQYYDIKYAEPPSGERRFKRPVPAEPWLETRNAMLPRKGCPSIQELDRIIEEENKRDVEDCLFLTISTKDLEAEDPVMVYIHGEFLYDGTSLEASPEYFMERDVVLVSVRYRLAPFGFLSTQTADIPGNVAVYDLILALTWIQKHIRTFGGDAKRVTLFGQVGGAALINLLTMSPMVPDNLFHQVIYQSGSVQIPNLITSDPLPYSKQIGKIAGCEDVESVVNLNQCFMKMNATKLIQAFRKHGLDNAYRGVGSYGGFQIVIGGPSGILPEHPMKMIRDGNIRFYPTMGGVTKNAGTFLLKEIFEDHFNETVPDKKFAAMDYINFVIAHTNGGDPSGAWAKFVRSEIFTQQEFNNGTFLDLMSGLIDMCGTIGIKNPLLLALQANAKQLPNNTFLYSFNYEGAFSRYLTEEDYDNPHTPFDMGVSLTDDNIYLFPWPPIVSKLDNRDVKVAKRFLTLFTSFATKGIPKAPGIHYWPPMTKQTGPYLRFDENPEIRENFLDEYAITSKEARNGNSLVIEEFWDKYSDDNLDTDYYYEEEH